MKNADSFLTDADSKTFDSEHRRKINFNIGRYNDAVAKGSTQFENHELGRQRASYLKTQVIENLDKYLIEFEANFTRNGGKVIWARDANEALSEIHKILKEKKTRSVVKSKTMTTEEIHFNEYLEKNGIESIETDLGEYIVQLAGQKPYHIVTPAMHMSRQDISELFEKKLGIPYTDDPQELTLTARRILREKYLEAEVGVSGANFIIADVGGIAVTENEGNARLCTTFPKTHIVIVGIEKLIPSMTDLGLFWPMLAQSGTGQQVTVYNTIFTGPAKQGESDGPEEMYVVLIDNGRTNIIEDPEKRQSLNCIRCGACLNVCPVYRNIGGHTYGSTYSGPIGSVITPHLEGMEKFKHLSYASTLCGACTSVCPVKIDLHNLLLLNRNQSVKEGLATKSETFGFKLWAKAMKNRTLLNLPGAALKNFMVGFIFKNSWGKRREDVHIAPKSFQQLWKERRK
ncbi:LutB/LldF family L-lactate oxidation iron-sulfur protein [uncultured Cytophaga sp.]|uniref:LutB/LldF family L-lactate oxidation iron-sulfur protein n=1 Tax=uncultured Cytophaga sp. TaxID=160238 RepID=UPI002639B6D3|nr:LutB/LldF family L-lactate oxidation iron-sulfur protein [uncultured Cytophaga sp.]